MRPTSNWRQRAIKVIDQALRRFPKLNTREMRRVLREEYPFGAREGWPYQCWLLEVRLALAAWAKLKNETPPKLGRLTMSRSKKLARDLPGQLHLFGGGGLRREVTCTRQPWLCEPCADRQWRVLPPAPLRPNGKGTKRGKG